jgi:hypothetical protein
VLSDGEPRSVISEYQRLAFAASGTESLLEAEDSDQLVRCISISFHSSEQPDSIRTGYPMTARLGYRAKARMRDVVFRVSFYWPSGYICAQLTNESSGSALTLEPGSGCVEFYCPLLPMVPGLYRVDVSIETAGRELDARQRCATLFVHAGKPVVGDFYIDNSWSIEPNPTNPTPGSPSAGTNTTKANQ